MELPLHTGINTFERAQKTAYDPTYPKNRKLGRCFKIYLNSADKLAGSLTAAQFQITLPYGFNAQKLLLSVDSWMVQTTSNSVSNLAVYPTYISIQELTNPLSYYSGTKGACGILQVVGANNFQNNTSRTAATTTLVDRSLFMRPITIVIDSPHYTTSATGGVTNNWTMVLSLYDPGEDA
jgi:hypothetical protein